MRHRRGGFTEAQLASTASYQAKNLQGIGLGGNDLKGWDLEWTESQRPLSAAVT